MGDAARRLALLGELHRIGKLIHGDPHAYQDLIVELEAAWEMLDEHLRDEGGPLPEEGED